MSILSHNQIQLLVDDGVIVDGDRKNINAASIDIRLGKKLLVERPVPHLHANNELHKVVLGKRQGLNMVEWDLEREGPFILYPGEFILAHSVESFNLPNNVSAEYKLKSSMARIGLEHLNAGWCDAGWYGSVLTMELKNMTRSHCIEIAYGDSIGQMVFFLHEEVPVAASYATRGRYNMDRSVSGAKPKAKMMVFGDQEQDTYSEEYLKDHPMPEPLNEIPRKVIEIGNEEETGNS